MSRKSKYAPELRERAVRMVFDHAHEHPSQWATIRSVAEKIGCTVEALCRWVRQAERDHGTRPGLTTDERTRPQTARARQRRVEAGERDPQDGVRVFCPGGARPPSQVMVAYIDAHRDRFGVEPICAVLPIAPSTYFRHKQQQVDPDRRSARAREDDVLRPIIRRIWDENQRVYGPRKVVEADGP